MKVKPIVSIFLILVFSIIFVGGTRAFSESSATGETTVTQKGVQISFQYLDKKMLFNRYGNRNNPFIFYGTGPLIAFDVSVEPTVDIRIETGDAVLESAHGIREPVTKSEITQYWGYRLRKRAGGRVSSQFSNWSQRYVLELLDAHVMSDAMLIRSQGEQRGLLLFESFRTRKGNATLKLPVYDKSSNLIHQFEFDILL